MNRYERGSTALHVDLAGGVPWIERAVDLERSDSAPTPVNAYGLTKDGESYLQSSFNTLRRITKKAGELAEQQNVPFPVRKLVKPSLTAAMVKRIENNNGKRLNEGHDLEVYALFADAEIGAAAPGELIYLLGVAPELVALELARRSHPYDKDAANEMDNNVIALLNSLERDGKFQRADEKIVKHYVARVDNPDKPGEIGALIDIRKELLGIAKGEKTDMDIIKRNSFVLDLQHPLTRKTYEEFLPWISEKANQKAMSGGKLRYEGPELAYAVETALECDVLGQDGGYLHTMVSSYYASGRNIQPVVFDNSRYLSEKKLKDLIREQLAIDAKRAELGDSF